MDEVKKEEVKKEFCAWCKHNPFNCEGVETACDFRTLPYDKDAIMNRLQEEYVKYSADRKKLVDGKDLKEQMQVANDVVDRARGMQIMVDRLNKDFGVPLEQIKKEVGFEPVRFVDRVKLATMAATMKRTRGQGPRRG